MELDLPTNIPVPANYDAIVFAVNHREYLDLDLKSWLSGSTPLIFDANCVLSDTQRQAARDAGCRLRSIGRGAEL